MTPAPPAGIETPAGSFDLWAEGENPTAPRLVQDRSSRHVPLGIVEELAAMGMNDTGTPNLGGAIVTAGGFQALSSPSIAKNWTRIVPQPGHGAAD